MEGRALSRPLIFGTAWRPSLHAPTFHDHFHFNFLKGELIVNHPEQFESSRVGYMIATNFNARVFLRELGMRLRQFTIQKKRNVSVESLL